MKKTAVAKLFIVESEYLLSIVECPIISPPLFNEVQRELPLLL